MVGDTLKKAGNDQNEGLLNIKDLGDTEYDTSKVSIAERRLFLCFIFLFFSSSSEYHRQIIIVTEMWYLLLAMLCSYLLQPKTEVWCELIIVWHLKIM
jgi:hypothetical protein